MIEKLNITGNYMDEDSLEMLWLGLHSNTSLLKLEFDSKDRVLDQ